MFLKLEGTFIVQLVNFAIFFAILNVVFIRPVGKAIAQRRAYINSVVEDYDRYQAEGAALRAQAEAIRSSARREAEATIAKARADASNEAAEISSDYAARAAEIVQSAHETVHAELQGARANEPALAADLANLVVDRTLSGGA